MLVTCRAIVFASLSVALGMTPELGAPSSHAGTASATPLVTAPGPTPPVAPDITLACRYFAYGGGWMANVIWSDNSSDEDGFIVEWKGPQGQSGSMTLPADTTMALTLPSGQGFRYRVGAFNASGGTVWSHWEKVTVGC